MNRPGFINRQPDWDQVHKNIVAYLSRLMIPCPVSTVYRECYAPTDKIYSEKTDPVEKLRQRYGNEGALKEVIVVPSTGDLALRRWFPQYRQLALLEPESNSIIIKGDCIVSYEAGYDMGRREPHMKDWFNDYGTKYRHNRQRLGKMPEFHVKHYFEVNYPGFFREAPNHEKWDQSSTIDFSLVIPSAKGVNYRIDVDVKTWTDKDVGFVRKLHGDIVYLFCEWQQDNTVRLDGVEWGRNLSLFYGLGSGTNIIQGRHLVSMDVLFVILNMAAKGLDYTEYRRLIQENESVCTRKQSRVNYSSTTGLQK